jgi:vancomycin permeability regulator SanA
VPLPRWLDRRWVRGAAQGLLAATALGSLAVAASVWWVDRGAAGHLYDVDSVPPAPVALVLGALVYPDGTPSDFLVARLALAQRLYDTGKVKVLLVSGDHSRPDYDEPDTMRTWLVEHGVPARKVVVDYAGFDTYDSCARARRIFGVRHAIVVTQTYHLDRAVSLCRALGLAADGVGDASVQRKWFSWWRASAREQGACVKAVFDLTLRRDPVFLGHHETGVDDALNDT